MEVAHTEMLSFSAAAIRNEPVREAQHVGRFGEKVLRDGEHSRREKGFRTP